MNKKSLRATASDQEVKRETKNKQLTRGNAVKVPEKRALQKNKNQKKRVFPRWAKWALLITAIVAVVAGIVGLLLYAFVFGEDAQNKKAVAKSGDYEIPYEQLRFVTMTYKAELDARYGDGNAENGTIWDDAATAEKHRAELEELVWRTLCEDYAILQACAVRGISRDVFEGKEIKNTVDQMVDDEIAQFASKRAYKDFLKEVYATENILRFKYALDEMKYLLRAAMKKDGAFLTEEQAFEEWFRDGNGAYVQHFLLYHESDEEKEANRAILEDARQKLISGVWTFNQCINYANEDLSNVAPYFMVRNVQKDVLVDAAVALENANDVSEVVEVEGALYVLVRMEEEPILGASGTMESPLSLKLTQLLSDYQWAIVGDAVEAAKASLAIELTDYGKGIDLVAMK